MKVEIINKKTLDNPSLEIYIGLETGKTSIYLRYRCPNCQGYGCHHSGPCDDHIKLEPGNVLKTLGEESVPLLTQLFNQILGKDSLQ